MQSVDRQDVHHHQRQSRTTDGADGGWDHHDQPDEPRRRLTPRIHAAGVRAGQDVGE